MRFFIRIASLGFFMVLTLFLKAQTKDETTEIKKIWDRGGHNAFTDINRQLLRCGVAGEAIEPDRIHLGHIENIPIFYHYIIHHC